MSGCYFLFQENSILSNFRKNQCGLDLPFLLACPTASLFPGDFSGNPLVHCMLDDASRFFFAKYKSDFTIVFFKTFSSIPFPKQSGSFA